MHSFGCILPNDSFRDFEVCDCDFQIIILNISGVARMYIFRQMINLVLYTPSVPLQRALLTPSTLTSHPWLGKPGAV